MASMTPDLLRVLGAGDDLVRVCHGASLAAGWWHMGTIDLRGVVRGDSSAQLIFDDRIGRRLGKALVAEKLCLIHSEISEAMEGHRKGKMDEHLPHRPSIEVELADAVIRIADLAGALQLDLGGAIADKMAYNAIRPDHKPEAREAVGGKGY